MTVEKCCELCGDHIPIAWRNGTLKKPSKIRKSRFCSKSCSTSSQARPVMARLWEMINKKEPEECWPWLGRPDRYGYGVLKVQGKVQKAHRYALQFKLERPLLTDVLVLHSCHNPICCNPAHLREGTHQENMDDKRLYGRQPRGETHGRAKLTSSQVQEIRKFYIQGSFSQDSLGIRYGVAQSVISGIVNRKIWKDDR